MLAAVGIGTAAWRVHRAANRPPAAANAKAIVVLGARVLPSGRATPALQYRAETGAALFLAGRAPLIIFSGGGAPSEASIARELAVTAGVPPEVCLVEEQSRSTYENAIFTAPMLKERGIDEILLVTDDFHLLRGAAHFARLGIKALPVSSGRLLDRRQRLVATAREALVLLRRPWLLF